MIVETHTGREIKCIFDDCELLLTDCIIVRLETKNQPIGRQKSNLRLLLSDWLVSALMKLKFGQLL